MKKLGFLLAMLLGIAAILGLSACGAGAPPYTDLNGEGANVSVRFDVGEGLFAGATDATVVDVFNPADYADGILLLTPDDSRRGNNAFEVSRPGHFLAGWYTERTETADGYVYEGRWDFENDRLTPEDGKVYDANTPALTLYAAWIPYCTYEFYDENNSLIGSYQSNTLEMPKWDERTGKLNMKRFTTVSGKTFVAAYLDEARTNPAPDTVSVDYDLERVSPASAKTVKLYTDWREGVWFRISTPDQLLSNARADGCYELMADLDFTGKIWPPLFTTGIFNGKIEGNGHTVSGVNISQEDTKQFRGGLFGALGATASIKDISFTDITYCIKRGSMTQGACFGLFAGTVASDATLSGVSVSGCLKIGADITPNDTYLIGLAVGTGDARIDFSNITCLPSEEGAEPNFTVDAESGEVTLSVA